MVHEVLSPSVQDTDKPDLSTKMLGISGKFAKRLRDRLEQNVIEDFLIPQNKRIDFRRNSKNHMEVWYRKEIFFPLFKPFFFFKELALRAMPVSARVVGYLDTATAVTLIYMASKLCSSASFYSPHGADMVKRYFMGRSVNISMFTKDIRNFYTFCQSHLVEAMIFFCVYDQEDSRCGPVPSG